eukprot:305006_1
MYKYNGVSAFYHYIHMTESKSIYFVLMVRHSDSECDKRSSVMGYNGSMQQCDKRSSIHNKTTMNFIAYTLVDVSTRSNTGSVQSVFNCDPTDPEHDFQP